MEEIKFKLSNTKTEAIHLSYSSPVNMILQHPQTIHLSNTDTESAGCFHLCFIFSNEFVRLHTQVPFARTSLKTKSRMTLVSSCISSRLDDCSSLLASYPHNHQTTPTSTELQLTLFVACTPGKLWVSAFFSFFLF